MIEKDLDEIVKIEISVFPHPWTKDFFRLIISDFNNCVLTLRRGDAIVGYGGYHFLKKDSSFLFRDRRHKKIIHLINIAIKPQEQKRGYGTFLMNTLLSKARSQNGEYCYLEVRPSNEKALTFYNRCGFSIIGIIDNYYPREKEDAIVMGKQILG
jgi:ribosomal-protein-alanine N-acetyltransferase